MKYTPWMFLLAASVRAATADAETELAAALRRLEAHKNYSWETTVTPAYVSTEVVLETPPDDGLPTQRREVTREPVAISGRTDSGRGTLIEGIVSQTGQPVTMKVAIWNERRVAETPEGWYTRPEIEAAAKALETTVSSPKRWNAENAFPAGDHRLGPSNYIYAGRFYMTLQPPLDELRLLLAAGGQPVVMDGTIVQTLGEATATKFWHELRFRDAAASTDNPPRNVEGRISIWRKNGEITNYEVVITGDVVSSAYDPVYRGREHTVRLVKTTKLGGFDQTEVAIPAKALARLNE